MVILRHASDTLRLSPRVRGNRALGLLLLSLEASIPACAGEPTPPGRSYGLCCVYPRVCGGTKATGDEIAINERLSPRVRGNPADAGHGTGGSASIPACAGEPLKQDGRGGTGKRLSPRVRGNLRRRPQMATSKTSIPACAGEPALPILSPWQVNVYPRVCGGTLTFLLISADLRRLSPRVRGNLRVRVPPAHAAASILACAGEPTRASHWFADTSVYPRVCGGTRASVRRRTDAGRLSPRVRGNPVHAAENQVAAASIPACAGEPASPATTCGASCVYPRVCGGTYLRELAAAAAARLSPRVRGNPGAGQAQINQVASIPACAGEPLAF